jgi:hypothetical protein
MTQAFELRCYEYVNRPYGIVREALVADSRGVFQRATLGAADRASAVAANLRVEIGVLEVGADITMHVGGVEERPSSPVGSGPMTKIRLEWQAAHSAGLFPAMSAELSIYALSPYETQLDLRGEYRPPLGAVGGALNALIGHRVAEASVHRFLKDVAVLLKETLPTPESTSSQLG